MRKGADTLREQSGEDTKVKILSSCLAYLQGFLRFDEDSGTTPDYIVMEVAEHVLGENWPPEYVDKERNDRIEQVLL